MLGVCADDTVVPVTSFRNNAIVSNITNSTDVLGYDGNCSGSGYSSFPDVAGTTEELRRGGQTSVSANFRVRASCGSESNCIQLPGCTSAVASCESGMFAAWDGGSPQGKATLLATGGGWKLGMSTPCSIASSSLDDSRVIKTDLYGKTRTTLPSMGAHEYDGPCQ